MKRARRIYSIYDIKNSSFFIDIKNIRRKTVDDYIILFDTRTHIIHHCHQMSCCVYLPSRRREKGASIRKVLYMEGVVVYTICVAYEWHGNLLPGDVLCMCTWRSTARIKRSHTLFLSLYTKRLHLLDILSSQLREREFPSYLIYIELHFHLMILLKYNFVFL